MSLSKQLLILISTLFLIIFSLNFVLSVNNIKGYLEGEAKIHAQDTATSLGLSLSPYMINETDPIIETTMRAIFDRGYYQEIKLVNVELQTLVSLTNTADIEGVPAWFVALLPMQTGTAESEISSGWRIAGVVSVTLNPGYAYLKLYEQVVSSFYYSLIALLLSIALLLLVLRITLAPLKKINLMAIEIAKGNFATIDPLPWTTEVRNVTMSMNKMSQKVEAAIKALNTKLESVAKKLQQDELTGLSKKGVFLTDMKQLFVTDTEAFIGLIKIDSLSGLTKELGESAIDQFIKDFSEVLSHLSAGSDQGDISVYRFFGAEFALIIREVNLEQVTQIGLALSNAFATIGGRYHKPDIVHIGITPFNPVATTESMLLAANEAYEQAQLIGANSFYVRSGEDQAKDIAQWKTLVFDVIDQCRYQTDFIGQINDLQTGKVLMQEAFTRVLDVQGEPVAIGTFIAIAEKFAKIVDLDKGVTEKVLTYLKTEQIEHALAINLSTRTIKNPDFRAWLLTQLQSNKAIAPQLVFSLSAYAVTQDLSVYQEFISFVQQNHARVMIKRFEAQSMSSEVLNSLRPDFIRLSRDMSHGLALDQGKQAFVEAMQGIGELLDIIIFAENVQADEDLNCLKQIAIAGASR
ncbi:MAG: EAL domain-containing protein [Methyloprofundus sp.]|nr:EAL domain-containing protein [Methyloprofundus sp.]